MSCGHLVSTVHLNPELLLLEDVMQVSRWQVLLLVISLGLFLSGTAFAKGGKGQGHGKGNSGVAAEHGNGHGHGRDSGVTISLGGHRSGDQGRPPGWDKGKKTGWGNCDVPPGQAKKSGCGDSIVLHTRRRTHSNRRHNDHRTAGTVHRPISPAPGTRSTIKPKPSPRGTVDRPGRPARDTGRVQAERD